MTTPDPQTAEIWTSKTEPREAWQVLCQCRVAGPGGRDVPARFWNLTRVDGELGLRTVTKSALYAGYTRQP